MLLHEQRVSENDVMATKAGVQDVNGVGERGQRRSGCAHAQNGLPVWALNILGLIRSHLSHWPERRPQIQSIQLNLGHEWESYVH